MATRFPEFLDLTEREKVNGEINSIANLLTERRLSFLCGAGLSSRSRVPMFYDLTKKMICDIFSWEEDDPNFAPVIDRLAKAFSGEAIAGAYEKIKDPARLQDLIADLFDRPDLEPHDGHKVLTHLASEGYIDRIYTTNFDNLLKKEFGGQGVEISNENITDWGKVIRKPLLPAKGKVAILHLHGRIERGQRHDVAITEEQTYSYETPLWHLFRADLLRNWFVFLGFRMNDTDLRTVYFHTEKMLQKHHQDKKTYVVLKFGADDKYEWKLAKEIWEHRQAVLIPMDAVDFLLELRDVLEDIVMKGWKKRLRKHLGVDLEDIERMLKKRLETAPAMGKRGALIAIAEQHNCILDEKE